MTQKVIVNASLLKMVAADLTSSLRYADACRAAIAEQEDGPACGKIGRYLLKASSQWV